MPTIQLPTHCDRSAVAELHPEFSVASETIRIDASKVERPGLALLQLLASAATSPAGLKIVDPSAQFREAAELAGIETLLSEGAQT
ncbi:MAG: STAS domain-containing protein [Erythrobacter sp.]|uniref:STAS domain-containing protein n=1 Tax=Erythrobacter sp. TaxID=1042 RepID=UPI003C772FBF